MGSRQAKFEDYDGFVEKFKPKRTTDDCMTPPEVYEAVASYVERRWGVARGDMVRPFWPGGDYETIDYPDGCCVVDNPPFSILGSIQRFYIGRGVQFFLFAPSLTCLSSKAVFDRVDHVICDAKVTYENGAVVRTSFITDLEPGVVAESCPELSAAVNAAVRRTKQPNTTPKYSFPDCVLTAARMQWLAAHGERLVVRRGECCHVGTLDAMRAAGKSGIYGGAMLLSERAAAERAAAERAAAERAAAERAAAERAAAEVWELSERERAVQALLGRG